jgi:ATP-dependent RNA helicase RhlE
MKQLSNQGIRADAIHADKTQGARQRALAQFDRGRIKVLVATDIVARGIDVEGISHVINYDMPNDKESYVHRIGRTARAGAEGIALSFCAAEEVPILKDIEQLTGAKLTVVEDHAFRSKGAERMHQQTHGQGAAKKQRGGNGRQGAAKRRGGGGQHQQGAAKRRSGNKRGNAPSAREASPQSRAPEIASTPRPQFGRRSRAAVR